MMEDRLSQLRRYASLMSREVLVKHGGDYIGEIWRDLIDAGFMVRIESDDSLEPGLYSLQVSETESARVFFSGEPEGHEVSSLVLAILQHAGVAPKISKDQMLRINSLTEKLSLETFYSAECTKCPEVVQILNIIALLNSSVCHTSINGAYNKSEAEKRGVMAVPATFLNGRLVFSGEKNIDEILDYLGAAPAGLLDEIECDVAVVGGGPAGVTSAMYAARKGLKVAIITDRKGGQLLDTEGIENITGVSYTTGSSMASGMYAQLEKYGVQVLLGRAEKISQFGDGFKILTDRGNTISRAAVLAPGAKWRELGVPGEEEFKNRGVTFCPHCDGPLFAGKEVAVVGGGNSGAEAALDLSSVASSVTLIELAETLPADSVLQESILARENIKVMTGSRVSKIVGQELVTGIDVENANTKEITRVPVSGVFIQAGLIPNTRWLADDVDLNKRGEIVVDSKGSTGVRGLFAAGDATDCHYKQISTSVGSGAVAAMGAADYLNSLAVR